MIIDDPFYEDDMLRSIFPEDYEENGHKSMRYKNETGESLVNHLKKTFEEGGYLVWCNHVNGNGVDMKTYGRNGRPEHVIEVWNWRYGNYPTFKRLMGVIKNLKRSKSFIHKLLVVSCLKPEYKKEVLKQCKLHDIRYIEIGFQVNPFWYWFSKSELVKYKMKCEGEEAYNEIRSTVLNQLNKPEVSLKGVNIDSLLNINKRYDKVLRYQPLSRSLWYVRSVLNLYRHCPGREI